MFCIKSQKDMSEPVMIYFLLEYGNIFQRKHTSNLDTEFTVAHQLSLGSVCWGAENSRFSEDMVCCKIQPFFFFLKSQQADITKLIFNYKWLRIAESGYSITGGAQQFVLKSVVYIYSHGRVHVTNILCSKWLWIDVVQLIFH